MSLFIISWFTKQYQKKVKEQKESQANKFYLKAKDLEQKSYKNPYAVGKLNQALILYEKCNQLVFKPNFTIAINECQQKITNCKTFLRLVDTANNQIKQKQFKEAIDSFTEAEKLFTTLECQQKITNCKTFLQLVDTANNQIKQKQFKEAIDSFTEAEKLFSTSDYQQEINNCKIFLRLVDTGNNQIKRQQFKEALNSFTKAEKLFSTPELRRQISKCKEETKKQENYEQVLKTSRQEAKQGKFQEAIDLIKPALNKLSREDGQQLLAKLEKVIRAKELYKSGLIAEQTGKLDKAKLDYAKAINFLPELIECKIRLSIILAKENPKQAISYLKGIEGEQAAYIRGFAYYQLGDWQQTKREWKHIHNDAIDSQSEIIKSLEERDRLLKIKEISSAVDSKNFEIAKTLSLEFIARFGSEPTIQQNLENHIQSLLERQIWESKNWQQITAKTEQIWLEQQDIKFLHNWAIANSYQAQTNPNKLPDFIIAWSTALANIEHNPTLQNIPWLGSNTVNTKDVSVKLKQILENAIDAVKDSNINEYLKLRDIYRREMVALSLVKQDNCGVRIKQQLLILPGCYQRFRNYLPGIRFPGSVWGALYTDWGLAVAACHEGDTARAIKIKPSKTSSSDVDNFAYCFVSYHEGCHYLQNLQWRKAIKPLKIAKPEITAKSDWCREIDRLCEAQRQKLDDLEEHLQFSKFWYELLDSQAARSYFAEYKALQIGIKLDDKVVSLQEGLDELQTLQNIAPNNSFILDLIQKVEINLELEKIDRLWQHSLYEMAVSVAKQSRHEKVRFAVAEVCINILLENSQSHNLDFDAMYQLAKWASELCPYEPAFMPIYSRLGVY